MKYLVTGGAGFVGSRLCNYLQSKGHHVACADLVSKVKFSSNKVLKLINDDVEFVRCDVFSDEPLLEDLIRSHDVVFHLAGLLGTDYLCSIPRKSVQVNVMGSLNIFELSTSHEKKVVNISLIPDWSSPYMITKNAADQFGLMYADVRDLDIVTLKFTHIYGPGQKWHPVQKAIPTFVVKALENENIPIWGSGNQLMDCIYIDDAVEYLYRASQKQLKGEIFEVGSGIATKVVDLANKIIGICGSNSSLEFLPMRAGEPDRDDSFRPAYVSDCDRLLGKIELTELNEGLKRTIQWYREILK